MGPAGAQGDTGNPAKLYYGQELTDLSFWNLETELATLSITDMLATSRSIKIDYSFDFIWNHNLNSHIEVRIALYRDSTIINTKYMYINEAAVGMNIYPVSGTFVDTASGTPSYSIKILVIIFTANSLSVSNSCINAMVFDNAS